MAAFPTDPETIVRRSPHHALVTHPERDRIEALYEEMFPDDGTYGRAAIIMTLTEERLAADLQMLLAFQRFIDTYRLEEVRNAVRALRRAGQEDLATALTAEGIQALIGLGLGDDSDEKLTARMEYSHYRLLQELAVTQPQDAPLIREALNRDIFDPAHVRAFVARLRGTAPAVADGAL